jgi:hypothetical protein
MSTTRVAKTRSPSNGRRLPVRALAALTLLAVSGLLLLAACGGGSGESTPSPGGTQAPAQLRTPAVTSVATGTPTPAGTPSAGQTQTPATAQPSAGELDPCALLTKAEVEAAIGTSVVGPTNEVVGPLASCYFNDPQTPVFHTVTVSVLTAEDSGQAREAFGLGREGSETVTGIGEDAYWDSVLNGLEVLKGKYDVSVNVSPDGWDARAVAEELAAKAVDRLP